MACKKDFVESLSFSKNVKSPYICLSQLNIYQLSSYITEYIGLSMIPYNIDQPIYNIKFDDTNDIDAFIKTNNISTLIDGAERKYGIKNFSIHFKSNVLNDALGVNLDAQNAIFKIRFLSHEEDTLLIATPLIILPKLKYCQVDELFDKFCSNSLFQDIVYNENKLKEYENKLKALQYQLCDMLFAEFSKNLKSNNIVKDIKNEILLFGTTKYKNSIIKETDSNVSLTYLEQITGVANYCDFNQTIAAFYDYIFDVMLLDEDDSNKIITFENLVDDIKNTEKYNISSVVDIFIDKGILVPEFIHNNSESIVRGYKCGEIFNLTQKGIDFFAYMLNQYADTKEGKPLDKIELEKLCVLFFKNVAYTRRLFSTAKSFDEDCFSICYSKFGPRVSDSNKKYKVYSKSALANTLEEKKKVFLYKDKYQISQASAPSDKGWVIIANNFSMSYYQLRQCFEKRLIHTTSYVRSFNDFITLLAIGPSQKNQMFALMAELYLLTEIDMHSPLEQILHSMDSYTEIKEDQLTKKKYRGIIDGIGSGLWKYTCFCQDDLIDSILNQAINVFSDIRYIKEEYYVKTEDKDENSIYSELIKKCGQLLYEIAYLFNYSQKRFTNVELNPMFRSSIFNNYNFNSMKMALKQYCETSSEQEIVHSFKTLKKRALALINECDLCIEEAALRSFRVHNDIVVLYDYGKTINKLGNEFNLKPKNENDVIGKCIFIKGSNEEEIPQQLCNILEQYDLIEKTPLILFVKIDNPYEGIFNSEHIATGDYFKELIRRAIKKSGYQENEVTCKIMVCSKSNIQIQDALLEFECSGELMDGYKYSKYKLLKGGTFMKNKINNGDFNVSGNLIVNGPVGAIGNGNVVTQNVNSPSLLNEFFNDVQQIDTSLLDDNDGAIKFINEIKNDAANHDKNSVLTKLGKLAEKIGSSVFAKIASSLIIETMKANGYFPF